MCNICFWYEAHTIRNRFSNTSCPCSFDFSKSPPKQLIAKRPFFVTKGNKWLVVFSVGTTHWNYLGQIVLNNGNLILPHKNDLEFSDFKFVLQTETELTCCRTEIIIFVSQDRFQILRTRTLKFLIKITNCQSTRSSFYSNIIGNSAKDIRDE